MIWLHLCSRRGNHQVGAGSYFGVRFLPKSCEMGYCGTYLLEEQTKSSCWKLSVGPEAAVLFLCFCEPTRLGGQCAALCRYGVSLLLCLLSAHCLVVWRWSATKRKKKKNNQEVWLRGFSCGEIWLAAVEFEEEQNHFLLVLWFIFLLCLVCFFTFTLFFTLDL